MKLLCITLTAVIAAPALAVLDFQGISPYAPNLMGDTGFASVDALPQGGYVAVGATGGMLLVVKYNAAGEVIKSVTWGSGQYGQYGQDVAVYPDGRLLVAVQSYSTPDSLIQFSPNLTVNWVRQRAEQGLNCAIGGDGTAYWAGNNRLDSYTQAGAPLGGTDLANFMINAIKALPSVSPKGVILAGHDLTAKRPRALRFSHLSAPVYERNSSLGLANNSAEFHCVDADAVGNVYLGGSNGNAEALYCRITNAGVMSEFLPAMGTVSVNQLFLDQPNTAFLGGPHAVARVTRATGAIEMLRSEPLGSYSAVPLTNDRYAIFTTQSGRWISSFSSGTIHHHPTAVFAPYKTVKLQNGAVSVGYDPDLHKAWVSLTDGVGFTDTKTSFPGPVHRPLLQSVLYPDGSVGGLSRENHPDGSYRSVLVRFGTDCILKFARVLALNKKPVTSSETPLATFADSSIAVAGTSEENTWYFGKLNAAGTPISVKTLSSPSGFKPRHVFARPDGSTAIIGSDSLRRPCFVRVSAAGVIVVNKIHVNLPDVYHFLDDAVVNAQGNIVVAYTKGEQHQLVIRVWNGTTGVTSNGGLLGEEVSGIRLQMAPNGNLIVGYRDGANDRFEARNPQTLALIHGRSFPNVGVLQSFGVAPNGQVVAAFVNEGTNLLRYFNGGDFAEIGASSLPAELVSVTDVVVDDSNVAYVAGYEDPGDTYNTYVARFLPNGVRSAQRRLAGSVRRLHVHDNGVWVTGVAVVPKKGTSPYFARYSL